MDMQSLYGFGSPAGHAPETPVVVWHLVTRDVRSDR